MPLTKGTKKSAGKRDDSPEPGSSKKGKYSSDEDEQPAVRKGKSQSSKMSKQGKMSKRSPNVISKASGPNASHNKPAELFRKDLISAMKLADTEILFDNEYFVISDPWRQEWEKGVQVPVNEEEILPSVIREIQKNTKSGDFKLPLRKHLHEKVDDTYQAGLHELTGMQELAEQIVRYDLDDQDVIWLEQVNEDREEMGLQLINEWNMERMIEELENQCYVKTNALKKTEEGLGIEYDEDVACDVCHMLESEDTNEMVFCDGCDICVHQACYGIQTIPEGSWLCRICALGIKPMCLLCPKRGGAMKSTKSGTKWTHVSCALWIPEVSIGCPEKMEPITKISNIPPSRWALVCNLCKERVGACIQCSVKQCKTAFHVTCGFAHNLDMKTIVDDSDEADGIHLRAYCPKHTKNRNASECESPKKEEDLADTESEVEVTKKRQEKLQQIEEDFFNLVDITEIAEKFFIPEEAVDIVAEYWKLKRRVNNNKPLITPKMEEEDRMQKQQKDSLSARMKMFVHLRQDLERARNLCYMISKREKTKRQFFRLNESVFHSQVQVLTDPNLNLSARDAETVRQEYHFDSIYSNYGTLSVRSSKQPRENLFNLHNLKTPKDYLEEKESCKAEVKLTSSQSNLGKEIKARTRSPSSSAVEPTVKSVANHRDNLFSVDNFNITSDSALESSEDESHVLSVISTHSKQMSRLGKVRLKEIEEQPKDEESAVIKTVPLSPTKKNFVPTSDLGKKLSMFLLCKTKMQQQQNERNHFEKLEQALHVDVGHSDMEEVFTSDKNTDLLSPVDKPRNLFDHFGMKGKPFSSSPDTPQDAQSKSLSSQKQHRKYKKRKHNWSPKIKKLCLVMSPSDQSSSGFTIKSEISSPPDTDELATRQVNADDARETSCLEPKVEASYLVAPAPKKCGRKKKIKTEPVHVVDKPMKLSPIPRVDADSVYATMDGDIYVPTGKILVTERTIVLNDLKEEDKSRLKSKLRLKKQADSPVKKGLASYIVVKDEDNSDLLGAKDAMDKLKKPYDDEKNIFNRVMDTTPLRLEESGTKKVPVLTKSSRKMSDSRVNEQTTLGSKHSQKTIPISDGSEETDTAAACKRNKSKLEKVSRLESCDKKLKEGLEDKRTTVDTAINSLNNNKRLEGKNNLVKEESPTKYLRTRLHDSEKTKTEITSRDVKYETKSSISPCKKLLKTKLEEKADKTKEVATSKSKTNRGRLKSVETPATILPHKSSDKKTETCQQDVKTDTHKDDAGQCPKTDGSNGYNIRLKHKKLELNHDLEHGEMSDENLTPKHNPSKVIIRSPQSRKSHLASVKANKEEGEHTDDFLEDSGSGVKLAQLPNKTHLNALLVASKLMVKVRKTAGEQLKNKFKLRGRWGSTNGLKKDGSQSTLDTFVKRTSISNVFSKMEIAQEGNGKSSCFSSFITSDLSPLRLNHSLSQNISPETAFGSPIKAGTFSNSIFGSHSSPRGSLTSLSVSKNADQNKTPDTASEEHKTVFGDVDRLTRQLSFEDISENAILNKSALAEVVKTPSKCDLSELSDDKLDGHRSYRSHSPPSSECSVTSCPTSRTDTGLNTPSRRITRSSVADDTPSPSTRLRKRDSLIKAPQFKL